MIDDPEIGRWMPKIPHPYSPEAGAAYLARSAGREGRFAIVAAGDRTLLGGISLVPKQGRAEIGYWIRADARGRGLAACARAGVALGVSSEGSGDCSSTPTSRTLLRTA